MGSSAMGSTMAAVICFAYLMVIVLGDQSPVHLINPRQNMWLTWAKETGQASFCLGMQTATDPFRTCLIGVPYWDPSDWKGWVRNEMVLRQSVLNRTCDVEMKRSVYGKGIPACKFGKWGGLAASAAINSLNVTLPQDPQEVDLLGSVAGNGSCIAFSWPVAAEKDKAKLSKRPDKFSDWFSVSSTTRDGVELRYKIVQNPDDNDPYCNGTTGVGSDSYGVTYIWNNDSAKAIPPGYFLVCGDRAWAGIPKRQVGGPCYIGKLTMFVPSLKLLKNQTHPRVKRTLKELGPHCDDQISFYGKVERALLSAFLPWGAAARALSNINKLACWAQKQLNLTSSMLSQLLDDMDSMRHAVLQNRAAIDFLLLAHGHGCEDFEGMCCMNLSDHSRSIHKQLQDLRDNFHKIKVESGLTDWLRSLGITGWLRDLIVHGLTTLLTTVIVLLIAVCALSCIVRLIKNIASSVWIAQKQKRGFVGFLEQNGHIVNNPNTVCLELTTV